MRRRANWLLTGCLDELVADYVFPVPVELLSTRVIVRTPEEGRAMLDLWHRTLRDRGVVGLQSKVVALDVPRGGRFRIWVDYHEVIPGQEASLFSSVLYYCSTTATGFQIEMVSYPRLSTPELNPQFAALALSA
ncbi:hypothetical protein [Tabrizicola sp.]|uniref:hypothetical protein n=1 Tax=Tabrizicola sp. TaxID=2005166 RepID=UPI002620B143|nr:hypothetical protein [Tabrizicola sp.]MDM7933359.1 hypothetical protein [Tabrizicola sp.]